MRMHASFEMEERETKGFKRKLLLRQVKRMRDKLSSIDFSKSDATQHLGEVQRGIYGQALQDINRIEARLQQAQTSLKLWRERQERPG